MAGIEEKLMCVVCKKIPLKEVYQCKNGDLICSECSRCAIQCPVCRDNLSTPKCRNKLAEDLLNLMSFHCKFKEFGCTKKHLRGKILTHHARCPLRGTRVKLCALLGFTCELGIGDVQGAVEHLANNHLIETFIDDAVNLEFERNNSSFITGQSITPDQPILLYNRISGTCLLLKIANHPNEKAVSFSSIYLRDENIPKGEFATPRIDFVIKTWNADEAPDMVWCTQSFELKHAEFGLKTQSFRIAHDVLFRYSVNGIATVACATSLWTNKNVGPTFVDQRTIKTCRFKLFRESSNRIAVNNSQVSTLPAEVI